MTKYGFVLRFNPEKSRFKLGPNYFEKTKKKVCKIENIGLKPAAPWREESGRNLDISEGFVSTWKGMNESARKLKNELDSHEEPLIHRNRARKKTQK